ncbi:MAG: hypothetical protein AABX14_00400 [Candidatus Aenigmatarchaeota archaeon]
MMKRVILDTSVYGELIKETDVVDKLVSIVPSNYVLYGTKIIRDELRDLSKDARFEGRGKRNLLLSLYDTLIKMDHHNLDVSSLIEIIASEFYKKYRANGGSRSLRDMINDFRIVACASFYGLDIVVSHDEKSMLAKESVKAYNVVCEEFNLTIPNFMPYRKFKEMISRD